MNLNLDILDTLGSTIIVGDFNAASSLWGYNYPNNAGNTIEDFLSNSSMELLYKPEDMRTFIHNTGNSMSTDGHRRSIIFYILYSLIIQRLLTLLTLF